MNTLPKFSEQYDKIIQAYFKDEIKPFDPRFCFCGTLAGGRGWHESSEFMKHKDFGTYAGADYARMEYALLIVLAKTCDYDYACYLRKEHIKDHPNYEDALFEGMSDAIDVLRTIHEERGEVIEDVPVFSKRNLKQTI